MVKYINKLFKIFELYRSEVPYIPYPVAFHTVDIIPVRRSGNNFEICLARKPGNFKFQTFGGFVDPGESAEIAAARELQEESHLVTGSELDERKWAPNCLKYLGSFFIDDIRYRNTPHKITSSLYVTYFNNYNDTIQAEPGDDIAKNSKGEKGEVRWFEIHSLYKNHQDIAEKIHWPLIKHFYTTYFHHGDRL